MSRKEGCENCNCCMWIGNDTPQCNQCNLYLCYECVDEIHKKMIDKSCIKTGCTHDCYDEEKGYDHCNHYCCIDGEYIYCNDCKKNRKLKKKYTKIWNEFIKYYDEYDLKDFTDLFNYISTLL